MTHEDAQRLVEFGKDHDKRGVPILGRSLFGRSLVHGYETHGREKLPPSGRKTKAQDKGADASFRFFRPEGGSSFLPGVSYTRLLRCLTDAI